MIKSFATRPPSHRPPEPNRSQVEGRHDVGEALRPPIGPSPSRDAKKRRGHGRSNEVDAAAQSLPSMQAAESNLTSCASV